MIKTILKLQSPLGYQQRRLLASTHNPLTIRDLRAPATPATRSLADGPIGVLIAPGGNSGVGNEATFFAN